MANATPLEQEVLDGMSMYQRFEPFLYDARASQDIAIYMALPLHSQLVSLAYSYYGLALVLLAMAFGLLKGIALGVRELWKLLIGVTAVFIFAFPITVERTSEHLYHKSFAFSNLKSVDGGADEINISLGPYFFLRFVNDLEDLIFPRVSLYAQPPDPDADDDGGLSIPEVRDAGPLNVMRAMDMNYYGMMGDEELIIPIRDYLNGCGDAPTESGTAESLGNQWAALGLMGSPTLGFNPSETDAQIIRDTLDTQFFSGLTNPLRRIYGQSREYARNLFTDGEPTGARAILAERHPDRQLGRPINAAGYKIPSSEHWRQVAISGDPRSVVGDGKTYLQAPTELQHPDLRPGGGGVATGSTVDREERFYATNCLEMYEIANLAMEQVYQGTSEANAPGFTDQVANVVGTADPRNIVAGIVLPERLVGSFAATQVGVQNGLGQILDSIRRNDGSRMAARNEGNPLQAMSDEGLADIIAQAAESLREVGLFMRIASSLPNVMIMSVGLAALVGALALLMLPITAMIGFITGNPFYLTTPIRVMLMMKLMIFFMFMFLRVGTEVTNFAVLYQMQQAMVGQPNLYGIAPFTYTMRVALFPLVTVIPAILAYMIAFAEVRAFQGFSPAAPGRANLGAGVSTVAAAGAVAAGPVGRGAVAGARAGIAGIRSAQAGIASNRMQQAGVARLNAMASSGGPPRLSGPPPDAGNGPGSGGGGGGGGPRMGGGSSGRTFEVGPDGRAHMVSGRNGMFSRGSRTPPFRTQTQRSADARAVERAERARNLPGTAVASAPPMDRSGGGAGASGMDVRTQPVTRPARTIPVGSGNPNPRGTDRR